MESTNEIISKSQEYIKALLNAQPLPENNSTIETNTVTNTPVKPATQSDAKSSNNNGWKVLGVIGGIILIAVVYNCLSKPKKKEEQKNSTGNPPNANIAEPAKDPTIP
jgi:hypothetical protein